MSLLLTRRTHGRKASGDSDSLVAGSSIAANGLVRGSVVGHVGWGHNQLKPSQDIAMSAEALGPRASWFRLPLQVALRKVLPVITRLVRSRPGLGSQGLEVGATRRLSTGGEDLFGTSGLLPDSRSLQFMVSIGRDEGLVWGIPCGPSYS